MSTENEKPLGSPLAHGEPGRMFVKTVYQKKSGGQVVFEKILADENEAINIRRFETDAAKVFVSMGLTINLGDFSSARIDVGLSVPCYAEERDAAYVETTEWVQSRVVAEQKKILEWKKGR